jgi:hypothetical protein
MSEQLEREMALAEAAYQQHRNALIGVLKQRIEELSEANRALALELANTRESQRQEMLAFEQSVLARMQALEQSVSRV